MTESGLSLKNKIAHLEEKEPWTSRESSMDKRDKAFIRDIQVIFDVDKEGAKKIYGDANLKSKQNLKQLVRQTKSKMNKKYYPKHKIFTKEQRQHILPSEKEEKRYDNQKKKVVVDKKKLGKIRNKETKSYLENLSNQKHKTYTKVLRGAYKHPNASKYELVHGYNSVASQKYRARHRQDKK